MISNEAWRELVAALTARLAFWESQPAEQRILDLSYAEVEAAPDIEVTWSADLEVIQIRVLR